MLIACPSPLAGVPQHGLEGLDVSRSLLVYLLLGEAVGRQGARDRLLYQPVQVVAFFQGRVTSELVKDGDRPTEVLFAGLGFGVRPGEAPLQAL
jgi:hypothetical protein